MTAAQRLTVSRIDGDRRRLHNVCYRRLRSAVRAGSDVAAAIRRPAMIAGLRGIKRVVLEAHNRLGIDARETAGHQLSAVEDDRDVGEVRELLGWLRLSEAGAVMMQARADAMADRVASEFRRLAERPQTIRLDRTPEPAGGNVARLLEPLTDDRGIFGRFGRANVTDSILDTWAETVAYSLYEDGRRGARDEYPAIAESLWGHRWSSILDGRETRGCHHLDGWVTPIGDSWMTALAPPRHFGCRSVLVEVWESPQLKRRPMPVPPNASLAQLQLYLREKEDFLRRLS